MAVNYYDQFQPLTYEFTGDVNWASDDATET